MLMADTAWHASSLRHVLTSAPARAQKRRSSAHAQLLQLARRRTGGCRHLLFCCAFWIGIIHHHDDWWGPPRSAVE